jgi:hypothetical protein
VANDGGSSTEQRPTADGRSRRSEAAAAGSERARAQEPEQNSKATRRGATAAMPQDPRYSIFRNRHMGRGEVLSRCGGVTSRVVCGGWWLGSGRSGKIARAQSHAQFPPRIHARIPAQTDPTNQVEPHGDSVPPLEPDKKFTFLKLRLSLLSSASASYLSATRPTPTPDARHFVEGREGAAAA